MKIPQINSILSIYLSSNLYFKPSIHLISLCFSLCLSLISFLWEKCLNIIVAYKYFFQNYNAYMLLGICREMLSRLAGLLNVKWNMTVLTMKSKSQLCFTNDGSVFGIYNFVKVYQFSNSKKLHYFPCILPWIKWQRIS